jgi:hypothetical protein
VAVDDGSAGTAIPKCYALITLIAKRRDVGDRPDLHIIDVCCALLVKINESPSQCNVSNVAAESGGGVAAGRLVAVASADPILMG